MTHRLVPSSFPTTIAAENRRNVDCSQPADSIPEPNVAGGDPALFVARLLEWYERNKRALPWRIAPTPYGVWVSEMMLQQTQVATVIPYWNRWMERFPALSDLAAAPLDDVLKQWQGLGYYARARNMHRAAQEIIQRYGGDFPTNFEEVLSLPGIGRYTAGAICSIALGLDTPIVDANVIRVLCRYFGLRGDPKSASVQEKLWALAYELIPTGRASAFNQGMMELGALVCQSKPECSRCPVQSGCIALATGSPESLPEFAPKPESITRTDVSAIVRSLQHPDRALLVRRPEGGLWGGLWEFPRVTVEPDEPHSDAAERAARSIAGVDVRATGNVLSTVRHGITIYKVTLVGMECSIQNGEKPSPADGYRAEWVPLPEIENYALSSPQARLYGKIHTVGSQLNLFD